jgi:hypothetical protein
VGGPARGGGAPRRQRLLHGLEHAELEPGLEVARLGGARGLVQPLLDAGEIGQAELDVDDLAIPRRIDGAHHVLNVPILEAAHDLHDRVHLADVGEELVAEPLALARTFHQTGDVHELHDRRHGPLGAHDAGQRLEPGIGHLDDAGIGLDRGERIVGHERLGGGERVEEGALADVGEADDA